MAMNTTTKKNKTKTLGLIAVILLLILALMGMLLFFNERPSNEDVSSASDYHHIEYNGKKYDYNSSIVSILFMGIDSTDPEQMGQADAMQLVLLNREEESIQVIALSRDIMTDIHLFDVERNDLGWNKQHLGLAYAYGDSPKSGAMLTSQAVSKLLYDVPVVHFAAMDLSILPELQNVVGELQVTVPNDSLASVDPTWTKGSVVTLNADNVESFVRTRDTEQDFSNTDRMERQKAYIGAYVQKIKEMLTNDFDNTVQLLYNVCKDMTTNITLDDIQSFSSMLLSYSYDSNSDFYTLQGENKTGELHDEFEVDQEALQKLVVELFYEEEN